MPWLGALMRPSLLSITAAAVGVSAIAHAVTVAGMTDANAGPLLPQTRMGVSIRQSLSDRDQDLARRTRAATLREQSARAAEQRLKADLESRQGPPDPAAMAGRSNAQDVPQPIEDLARIYQTMRPARAAPIFAALDLDVQTQIAKRMRERAVALIMANMDPGAAVRLSMALAGRTPASAPVPQPAMVPVAYQGAQPPSPRDRIKPAYAATNRADAISGGRPVPSPLRAPGPAVPRLRPQAPKVQPIAMSHAMRPQAAAPAQAMPAADAGPAPTATSR